MKLHSLETVVNQIKTNEVEMVAMSEQISRREDVSGAITRIRELDTETTDLEALVEALESNGEPAGATIDDEFSLKPLLDIESTVDNVASVVDRVLGGILNYINSGISDEDKTAVASRISNVESFNTLHFEVTNALKSGRGTKMPADEVVELREKFKADWEADNSIKYPDFIKKHGVNMKYYSVVNLIKGETYTDVGGPVRGQDYDVAQEVTETVTPVEATA